MLSKDKKTGMITPEELERGKADPRLAAVYGNGGAVLRENRQRYRDLMKGWERAFGKAPEGLFLFTAPGRTELAGNHTDHQRGCVLAAAVDRDTIGAARPNGRNEIRICSEGYACWTLNLDEKNVFSPRKEEKGTSGGLLRGIAAGFARRKYPPAGFDAYIASNVTKGSGLSSSAAFEVLLGVIFNEFCAGRNVSTLEIARIAKDAENRFFGKPCGLMDQMAAVAGGVLAMDFANPEVPWVEGLSLDLEETGYGLCIIDTGRHHEDLTREYRTITREMRQIAAALGESELRDIWEAEFYARFPVLYRQVSHRAILRAIHFFEEQKRVRAQTEALKKQDFETFLRLAAASGRSSFQYLQNVSVSGKTAYQPLVVALAVCEVLLRGKGAFRVHGGGFAGTIQAFVPLEDIEEFRKKTEGLLGKGCCQRMNLRQTGGAVL